jgi:hypothetical protein
MLVVATYPGSGDRAQSATGSAPGDVSTVRSGNWSNPDLWSTRTRPQPGQTVHISAGHTVVFDTSAVIEGLELHGTLDFSRNVSTTLETTDNILVHDGGELIVGTPEDPIPQNVTAKIVFNVDTNSDFVGGAFFEKQDTGLWVMTGGRWDSHGAPVLHTWTDLAADSNRGSDTVVAHGNLADWPVGATVLITATGLHIGQTDNASGTEDEERRIVSVTPLAGGTSRIKLDAPLTYAHTGTGDAKGEIALLSRNVIVMSKSTARAHTMYMYGSDGSLSHTLFKHLGPRDVLSRYPVHFHVMAETSIGRKIRGNVVWDSENRFFVVHNSLGVELADNIGYRGLKSGFWLESTGAGQMGPEPADNVLIHNLCVIVNPSDRFDRRLAAFYALGENHFIDNTAVSVGNATDASGFLWPEGGSGRNQVFASNESHSNYHHGLFGWQNNSDFHVLDATVWRNQEGVQFGAYQNIVEFHRLTTFGNAFAGFTAKSNRPYIQDSTFFGEPNYPTQYGFFISEYTLPPSEDNPGRVIRTTFSNHDEFDVSHLKKTQLCALGTRGCTPTFTAFIGAEFNSPNTVYFGSEWETTNPYWDFRDSAFGSKLVPDAFRLTRPDQSKPSSGAVLDREFNAWLNTANSNPANWPAPPAIEWLSAPAELNPSGPTTFKVQAAGLNSNKGNVEFFVDEDIENSWRAEYFDNAKVEGNPVVVTTRNKADVYSSSDKTEYLDLLSTSGWSARFTRTVKVSSSQEFFFDYIANDGIRIKVDGQVRVNEWEVRSSCCGPTGSFSAVLGPGTHTIVVEFFAASYGTARLSVDMYRKLPAGAVDHSFTFDPADWRNRQNAHIYARAYDAGTGLYAYTDVLEYENPRFDVTLPQPDQDGSNYPTPEPSGTPEPSPSATSTPGSSQPSTSTPVPNAGTQRLVFSTSADRSYPSSLHEATVANDVYVFTSAHSGVDRVQFYLDDSTMSGSARQVENSAPFDFAGGSSSAANWFDTTSLNDGQHTITALIEMDSGPDQVVHATFTVKNSSPETQPTSTPTPVATPSPQPTATATPNPAPAPQPERQLVFSTSRGKSGAQDLDGSVLSGDVYIFVDNEAGVDSATFYLDDTSTDGKPYQVEINPPFDFAGGSSTAPKPFDAGRLRNGEHTITVVLDMESGGSLTITATFSVTS